MGNPRVTFVSFGGYTHVNPPQFAIAQHIRAFLAAVDAAANT
jgi:hypothetical protein